MSTKINDLLIMQRDPEVIDLVRRLQGEVEKGQESPSFVHAIIHRNRSKEIYKQLDQLLRDRYGRTADEISAVLSAKQAAKEVATTMDK